MRPIENINMIILFQNNQILQDWLSVVSCCNIFKHKLFAFTTSSHKKLSLFIDRCYPEKQFYNNETKNKPSLNKTMSWFRHQKFANGFFCEILDTFTHRSRYFKPFLNKILNSRSLSSWGCVEATVLSTAPERYTVVQCTLMYSDVCLLTPVKREWTKQLLFLLDFLYSTRANFSFRPCAMHNWAKYFLKFF